MSYPVYYVPAGDVLPVPFATYAGSTGASATMTGLAVTDIEIYKDGSTTQRASDAGYTLLDTDGIDFDGITGIHGFSIDTGDNTDAGFYTVGSWFTVVVSAVTVDSQTVSFIACQFRLMAAESVAAKPKVDVDAWLGTAAATPTVAGVPEVDLTHIAGSAVSTSSAQLGVNVVNAAGTAWGSGAITAGAIAADAITAAKVAADVSAEIADAVWDEDATAHQTGGTFGQAIGDPGADTNTIFKAVVTDATGATVGVDVAAVLVDTAEIGAAGAGLTEAGGTGDHLTALATAATLSTVSTNVDAILVDTGTTLQAELDGIQADTEDIQTRLPAALVSGRMSSDAVAISGSTTAADRLELHATGVLSVVIGSGSTTTSVVLNATTGINGGAPSSTNDFYNSRVLVFITGTLAGQATDITDYVGATVTATVTALTGAPAAGDTAVLV